MSFNKFLGMGRLAKDVDLKISKSGVSVAKFTLAVDSGYGEKKETAWLPIICFNKTADNVATYLKKGSQCFVECTVKTGSYEKNGKTIYTTDFIANNVQFISGKSDSVSGGSTADHRNKSNNVDIKDIPDSDIPF